ncbi:MAG TPA: hypothetical protein VN442_01645 [Bryobacteraceae bacterium]|nr:hypothetical protein [Bryobacteraceae bacterium]
MTRYKLLILGAPVLILALAGTFCGGGKEPEPARKTDAKPPAEPKVLQFYSSVPAVARGEQALLCYGVENAEAVRIEPAVEPLKPAYSRCVAVTPRDTTRYTLTVEGAGGRTATATLTVQVQAGARKAAAPAPAATAASGSGPVIASFRTETKQDAGGAITLLCYEVEQAEAVAIEPGVMPRSGALRGCLGVAPKQPTTYFLTAFGRGGKTARRALTVGK